MKVIIILLSTGLYTDSSAAVNTISKIMLHCVSGVDKMRRMGKEWNRLLVATKRRNRQIAASVDRGEPVSAIAARYGISRQRVHAIVKQIRKEQK